MRSFAPLIRIFSIFNFSNFSPYRNGRRSRHFWSGRNQFYNVRLSPLVRRPRPQSSMPPPWTIQRGALNRQPPQHHTLQSLRTYLESTHAKWYLDSLFQRHAYLSSTHATWCPKSARIRFWSLATKKLHIVPKYPILTANANSCWSAEGRLNLMGR